MPANVIIFFGSFNAAIAILLGAFAAHSLKASISEYSLGIFKTAADFQLWHGLGLILLGLIARQYQHCRYTLIAYLFIIGITLFSGSLYLLSLTNIKILGAITPFGGVSLIIAWCLLSYKMITIKS